MNRWNADLTLSKRKVLLTLVTLSVIILSFGALSRAPSLGAVVQPTTVPVTQAPPSTPAPPGIGAIAPLPGVYAFRAPGEETPDYLVELRADGRAFVEEKPVDAAIISTTGTGVWWIEQGDAVITLTSLATGTLASPETIRLKFEDGFPAGAEAKAGGAFERLPLGVFTLGTGEEHPLVPILHRRLAALAWLNFTDPGSDIYEDETRQAVADFQEAQGLPPSGVLDARTWMRLGAPLPPQPAQPPTDEPKAGELPAHTGAGKPILYMTFDDGPMPPNTTAVLDLLDKYHAKATFFVVGTMVAAHPETVRDEIARGHVVGNHTWNHKSLKGLARQRFNDQVERTDEAIDTALGNTTSKNSNARYLRPPYGATDKNTKRFADSLGYHLMMWNVDPQDWRRPEATAIVRNVLKHARPGAVILLHDGGGNRSRTLAALRTLLPELKAQGYVFRALPAPR